jgi:hypothetical protein
MDDPEVSGHLVGRVVFQLFSLADATNDRDYEKWRVRANGILDRSKLSHADRARGVFQISRLHRVRANYLIWSGASNRARTELENDLEFLRSVPAAETELPEVILSKTLTLAVLGESVGDLTSVRSAIRKHPTNRLESDWFEIGVAELTARRIGWLPSLDESSCLILGDLPSPTWADRAWSILESHRLALGLDVSEIPKIGLAMRHSSVNGLGWQRRVKKLDEARRIADQMVALAERFSRSFPVRAEPYMLLSDGYIQKAKNAYREDDESMVERSLQNGMNAALHAASLHPENEEARDLVRDRRARLAKHASGKNN